MAAGLQVVPLAAGPVRLLVFGAWGYTRRHVPWPTVSAMVGLATPQLVARCWIAA